MAFHHPQLQLVNRTETLIHGANSVRYTQMHVIPGGGYNRTLLCVKQTDTKPDDFMMFDHVTMAPESVSVHNVSLQGQGESEWH